MGLLLYKRMIESSHGFHLQLPQPKPEGLDGVKA